MSSTTNNSRFLNNQSDSEALPIVSLTSEQTVIPEGEEYTWNFALSQPAPADGLTLNVDIFSDTDPTAGDFRFSTASSTNIANFQSIVEDGNAVGYSIQVAPGATEASVVFDIIDDGITEGQESAIDVLLPGTGYQIDPDAKQVTFTLTDAQSTALPIVSLTSEQTVIPEGEEYTWNFALNQPAPADGLTLNVDIFSDTDPTAGDFRFSTASSTNIANFQSIVEDGNAVGYSIQVAPGATEASVVFDIIDDGITEGQESAIDVLLPGTGYQIDPDAKQVTFSLTDATTSTEPIPSLGEGEVLDLRNVTSDINATFAVQSQAFYNNIVGFYVIDDLTGRIGSLTPGDTDYAQAALTRRVGEISNRTSSSTAEFNPGFLFAPYLIANGTVNTFLSLNPSNEVKQGFKPIAYFGFAEANPDKIDHFRTLDNNLLGVEDLYGGGDLDFNDAVLQISFTSVG